MGQNVSRLYKYPNLAVLNIEEEDCHEDGLTQIFIKKTQAMYIYIKYLKFISDFKNYYPRISNSFIIVFQGI